MASPRTLMITGLSLLATAGLSIWLIVIDFRTHAAREADIDDCYSSEKTTTDDGGEGHLSSVPLFFGASVITKICVVLLQLATAVDYFVLADVRLKNKAPSFEESYCLRMVWGFIFFWACFVTVCFSIATLVDTDCVSCCLRHGVIRRYMLWTSPALLFSSVICAALAGIAIYWSVVGCINFAYLIFRTITFSEDDDRLTAKEQELASL